MRINKSILASGACLLFLSVALSGCGSFSRWYDSEYWFGEDASFADAAYPALADLPVPSPSERRLEEAAAIAERLAAERLTPKSH